MNFGMNCFWFLLAATVALCAGDVVELTPKEGRIIAECLQRFGGPTEENAERLQRFKHWSDTYEEIPCFTKCYISKMFDIYNETVGFIQDNVISQFGHPLFTACKHRMIHGRDSCALAYNGFHCIVSLENDPFVVIESMAKISSEAKTVMKDCLHKFDQYEWQRINEYSSFPVREPIPCFSKCFLSELQMLNERTKQWNIEGMRTKLGVPAENASYSHCSGLGRRRNRNSCAWMYQEFTCFVKAE